MREMKDSGIEWIGEIPKEWQVRKIKHIRNSEVNSFVDGDWIESPFITDEGICYLTTGNIGDGFYKKQGNSFITLETFIKLNCKYAYPNDLIISRLNAPYGRSCILTEDYTEYVIAVDNVILRTDENKKFLCYVTQCKNYQISVLDKSAGTTMKRISRTNLGNIFIPLPPRSEQNAIASYLDKKCSNIDAIITKNEQIIEKLKEYKSSLISETVTKGLNPDVEMKDSGVEWIGKIPADWEISKLKWLCKKIITGKTPPGAAEEYYNETGLSWFTPGDLGESLHVSKSNKYLSAKGEKIFDIIPEHSILMICIGDIGRIGINDVKCTTNQQINAVICDNKKIVYSFLGFYLYAMKEYIAKTTKCTILPILNQSDTKNIIIPFPSLSKQNAIASYLDEKCLKIDANIKKRELIIQKLAEYKKSLIYEAVTGKKEII